MASESGEIIILDTQSFAILQHVSQLSSDTMIENGFRFKKYRFLAYFQARVASFASTPSLISVGGQYDYDFRIVVATREGKPFIECILHCNS